MLDCYIYFLYAEYFGIRTIARIDAIPKDTIPNEHNPERTQSRMDISPNGHYAEWTLCRMDTIPNSTIPNEHNPEWTSSRMGTIPNGHHPEWAPSRMDTIPNEHLPSYGTLVFYTQAW